MLHLITVYRGNEGHELLDEALNEALNAVSEDKHVWNIGLRIEIILECGANLSDACLRSTFKLHELDESVEHRESYNILPRVCEEGSVNAAQILLNCIIKIKALLQSDNL